VPDMSQILTVGKDGVLASYKWSSKKHFTPPPVPDAAFGQDQARRLKKLGHGSRCVP
jgi:hypothetical protein